MTAAAPETGRRAPAPLRDRPGVRVAAFAAALAVVFGALFGVGRAAGPWDLEPAPGHDTHQPIHDIDEHEGHVTP